MSFYVYLFIIWTFILHTSVWGYNDGIYFSVSPEKHIATEGSPVILRCEAEPKNKIRYSWTIDGQPLVQNPRRYLMDGNLHITRVNRMYDSGDFVCIATDKISGNSIESSSVKVIVQWISEASIQLQEPKTPSAININGEVEFRCHVDGSGELKYEWFRNKEKLERNERIEMKKNKLHIHKVNVDDNGIYTCQARNEVISSPVVDRFPLIVHSNDTAIMKNVPKNLIIKRGERATFHCEFENANSIKWFFNNITSLEQTEERSIFQNGTLIIHNVDFVDQGTYYCQGHKGNNFQTFMAELQIAYLRNLSVASLEPSLPNQLAVVGEGQELQITCLIPSGSPVPKIYWKNHEGHIISDSGSIRVQENTLIITKADVTKKLVNYTCIAENLAGTTEITVQVFVSTPPSVIYSPESLTVMEEESVSLSCGYRGEKPPVTHIKWLKDNEPLKESGGPTRYRINYHNGNVTLFFKNLDLADKGTYKCEITTKGFPSISSNSATIAVQEKLKFSPQPVSRRLERGSSSKVSCKAQGSTNPIIKWIKENNTEFPKNIQDINGTLHFNGVSKNDKGQYTCIAKNSQGSINHTIDIDVVVSPKFTIRPQNPTEAVEGYSVILHCEAEGDPKPTIQWDKDTRMNSFNDSRFEFLTNGSLYIKEIFLTDEGKYGCTAGNSGGLKREEIQLNVKAGNSFRSDLDFDSIEDQSMMTKTVTITLSAAAAYMILVVGLMLYCRYRRRKRKQQYLQELGEEKLENGEVQEEQIELNEKSSKANTTKKKEGHDSQKSDGAETAQSHSSNNSKKSKTSYEKIAISRANLKQMKPLGRGEFGDLFSAKYHTDGNKINDVMVKTLVNVKDENALQEFKRHLDLLHRLNHENVAKLIGLCREEEPDYMIIEYTEWGDLKQFLIASGKDQNLTTSSSNSKPNVTKLAASQINSLICQAALGLKHLADHRLVHKDIAARNCMITSNLSLKISMPCMTKEPYQKEYTKFKNQVIPLRWLPYEAVYEDDYSTKSDVFSFACLIWEIFHQGELPFNKLNDESVLTQLKAKTLLWKAHKSAPIALQELQILCWSYDPRERPNFEEIVSKLNAPVVNCL
ncbi:tyrosine-protein kinase-like otk [Leptopilina boulardi]|uniref:tyrosine-protein kinase-like otk n=1 Tax=Leptopilina boulardi TaxID=63433 RepID=UPI0021F559E8|nr:tyrosine-protein kinase-like otk [Leptopilina boulardi]